MYKIVATSNRKWAHARRYREQRGQTTIFVVLGIGLVFLAVLGFAIDFGNLWFKRQAAQSAADAACTAAVMDMLWNTSGGTTKGNFPTPAGTAFNCSSGGSPTAAPCQYAALNGYNGSGLVANTESNSVEVTFPSSITGNPVQTCPSPIPPGTKVCIPPSSLASNSLVQVKVTDRMRAVFFGLVSSNHTVDVPAKATCGLVLNQSPIPLLILDPTRATTLELDGGAGLKIYGGPQTSIQINSSNAGAFSKNGNNGQIDLSQGGPTPSGGGNPTGSDMHVAVSQTTPPSTSTTSACVAPPSGPDLCLGTTGNYGTHLPILDPFALTDAPGIPSWPGNATVTNNVVADVDGGTHGCPAPTGQKCTMYSPGHYTSDINLGGQYAIFQPGIYYLDGSLNFGSNSCVRPSTDTGDGSKGTFFYFAGNGSINVPSNSGCNRPTGSGLAMPATNFNTTSGTGAYPLGAFCDATSLANRPSNLPSSIAGSVLLAPCQAPTVSTMCAPNCSVNGGMGYGDPLGSTDPAGVQRGLLFFQNRAQALSNSNMPSWQGGGAFLISGSMYFHQCKTSGSDSGTGCTSAAYTDQLTLGGNSSGTSYILGDIVTDQMKVNGGPNLYMDLSPNATYYIFKASLLQ